MISTIDNSLYDVKKKLFSYGILITAQYWVDHHRKVVLKDNRGSFWFLSFKRQSFHTFNQSQGKPEEGESETVNVDDFEEAVYERNVERFLFSYADGKLYCIRSCDIKKNSVIYKNNADGREQFVFSFHKLSLLG